MVQSEEVSLQTIIFVIKQNQVLLARKRDERKLGGGKFNGYGGKLEKDESIKKAAVRELHEESNLRTNEKDLKFAGIIKSSRDGKCRRKREVYIFTVDYEKTSKNYISTTEMVEPTWYNFNAIPYDVMWPDSELWMPKIFQGCFVDAQFLYGSKGNLLQKMVSSCQLPMDNKELEKFIQKKQLFA